MDIISYLLGKNAGGGGGGSLQELTVTPTNEEQVKLPEEGYTGFSKVVVEAIPEPIIPPEAGVLESIVVGSLPDKTTYIEGEPLDLTGLVILGNFSNGYQYDVTSGCTFICNDPVTYYDTKITAKYVVLDLEKTIDIPITVNGVPVQAPAETKGLWHFDAGTDKNEVNGKGTSTSGLVDPQSVQTSTGVFGTTGTKQSSAIWLNYNNTLALTNYAVGTITSSDFTYEFWFCPNSSGALFISLLSKATNYSTDIGLKVGSGGVLSINGSSGWLPSPTLDATVTASLNSWHHFAFVNNHATRKIYIDGKLWATSTANPSNDLGLAYISIRTNSSNDFFDEVLFTENAKYLTNFEPPHAEYYLAGGE